MSLQVIVPTCDLYTPFMPGFFHQWRKYCGLKGMVVAEMIAPKLPPRWSFYRGGTHTPDKGWAGNLRYALDQVLDEVVLVVLDDYYLTQQADVPRIQSLAEWFIHDRTIDKIDLTNDRLGFAHAHFNADFVRSLPMANYLTSVQAALWRTSYLKQCLSDVRWNPWQFEVQGSRNATKYNHKVLGCKTPAIHYCNMVLKGKIQQMEINKLPERDQRELRAMGAIE